MLARARAESVYSAGLGITCQFVNIVSERQLCIVSVTVLGGNMLQKTSFTIPYDLLFQLLRNASTYTRRLSDIYEIMQWSCHPEMSV